MDKEKEEKILVRTFWLALVLFIMQVLLLVLLCFSSVAREKMAKEIFMLKANEKQLERRIEALQPK